MTPRGNPKPRDNPPNPVPNVQNNPGSDPNSSDFSSSESSDSSGDEYYKWIQLSKRDKNKHRSKTLFEDWIKKYAKLTANLLTAVYISNIIKFILYKDPLYRQFYLLYFINWHKHVLSKYSETYMLLMEYPFIRGK